MLRTNTFQNLSAGLSTTLLLSSFTASAQTILVQEAFDGTGAILDGTSAEIFDAGVSAAGGSSNWVAADTFLDNGGVVVGTEGNSGAHLNLGSYINDAKGSSNGIFELTMTIGDVTGEGNTWFSMGFSALNSPATSNHFLNRQGTGTIILRTNGELDMWAGPGNTNTIDGPDGNAGDRTLTVTIDLSTHNGVDDFGSVTWSDSELGEINSHSYTSDTDFGSIYFSEANPTASTLSEMTLTQFGVAAPVLNIAQAGGTLEFSWDSIAGNQYDLVSSADLSTAPSEWSIYDDGSGPLEAIEASGTGTNTLSNIARVGETRFFALRAEAILPSVLFSADFEADNGGFVATNETTTGSIWEYGFPDASGLGGDITGGSGTGSVGAWGIALGEDENSGGADPGHYSSGTSTTLSSPIIDLTGASVSATLSFDENLDFPAEDLAEVYLVDEATGLDIGTEIYTSTDPTINATGWTTVPAISLPAEALGKQIRIEFRFTGDGGTTSDFLGWYIDNVIVEGL